MESATSKSDVTVGTVTIFRGRQVAKNTACRLLQKLNFTRLTFFKKAIDISKKNAIIKAWEMLIKVNFPVHDPFYTPSFLRKCTRLHPGAFCRLQTKTDRAAHPPSSASPGSSLAFSSHTRNDLPRLETGKQGNPAAVSRMGLPPGCPVFSTMPLTKNGLVLVAVGYSHLIAPLTQERPQPHRGRHRPVLATGAANCHNQLTLSLLDVEGH